MASRPNLPLFLFVTLDQLRRVGDADSVSVRDDLKPPCVEIRLSDLDNSGNLDMSSVRVLRLYWAWSPDPASGERRARFFTAAPIWDARGLHGERVIDFGEGRAVQLHQQIGAFMGALATLAAFEAPEVPQNGPR